MDKPTIDMNREYYLCDFCNEKPALEAYVFYIDWKRTDENLRAFCQPACYHNYVALWARDSGCKCDEKPIKVITSSETEMFDNGPTV